MDDGRLLVLLATLGVVGSSVVRGSTVRTGLPATTSRTFVLSVGGFSTGPERSATMAILTVDPRFFSFAKRAKEAFLQAKKKIDTKAVRVDRLVVIPPSTWTIRWFEGGEPDGYKGALTGQLVSKLEESDATGFEIFDFDPLAEHSNEIGTDSESEIYGNTVSVDANGVDFRAFEVDGMGRRVAVMAYVFWETLGI